MLDLTNLPTISADLALLAAATASFVKALVDTLKGAAYQRGKKLVYPRVVAMISGPIIALGLLLLVGQVLTLQTVAAALLAGIVAAAGAIGLTENHKRARGEL